MPLLCHLAHALCHSLSTREREEISSVMVLRGTRVQTEEDLRGVKTPRRLFQRRE